MSKVSRGQNHYLAGELVCVVVVVVLLFYIHSKHLRSCRDVQLT